MRARIPRPQLALPPGGSLLAVAAHPDDIESWCAGTLALAIDAGAQARLLLVTSGDSGSSDPQETRASVAARREAEALDAAARLGLAEVAFQREPDGELEDTRALRAAIAAAIRRWRPDTLLTHDPEQPYPPYLSHRDHRIVGRAALDAVYPLARDRLALPELEREGLQPHKVASVWLFATRAPTHLVDISAGLKRKIAARLAHASQTSNPATLMSSWHTRAAEIGAPLGLAAAEAFTILPMEG